MQKIIYCMVILHYIILYGIIFYIYSSILYIFILLCRVFYILQILQILYFTNFYLIEQTLLKQS